MMVYKRKVPKDSLIIDTSDAREMNYWMKELKCSRERLLLAVSVVGSKVRDVEDFLR